ncbi:MAG TPA: type VI secretion system baseplate subunit TssG [Pseudomonas sp.]|uniref:type VI secretion system baseplate subunit TssG n=1 Tax=Pseudomonas sp. TaxID=306 RepID=UPI002B4633A8|nr:type VI secretion system baseplate subunit TssG [Pseudomonas sp.]HKS13146.1 type VI secretion system baseplate subunit TssG [Pseudomonas sp.]
MERQARAAADPVNTLEAMHAEPWAYDFFQALRRLEAEHPELPRFGHSLRLADEPVRLGQRLDCAFAPATLASVTPGEDDGPARLEQFFFGLGGPNGPLPLHLTEHMRERQRNHADHTSKRFLDIFHHRLLSLFYRAWAEARPTVSHDRPGDDYWAARLAALSGRGQPALRGQGPLPDNATLHFSGHLAAQTRYPDGLCSILADYFGVPVTLEEYVGQWLKLPERSQLGVRANRLGVDLCLGRHVWDRQHKFRLCVGPLTLDQYHALLPGGTAFIELAAWVAEYQGQELDWELNLILRRDQVPALRLDAGLRLGFDTWLGQPADDANDLKLARYYAEQPLTPPSQRSQDHG